MNAFIPENPTVVLLVGSTGLVNRHANNIDPAINVVVTQTVEAFEEASRGVTFDSARPPGPAQVLAHKKN